MIKKDEIHKMKIALNLALYYIKCALIGEFNDFSKGYNFIKLYVDKKKYPEMNYYAISFLNNNNCTLIIKALSCVLTYHKTVNSRMMSQNQFTQDYTQSMGTLYSTLGDLGYN